MKSIATNSIESLQPQNRVLPGLYGQCTIFMRYFSAWRYSDNFFSPCHHERFYPHNDAVFFVLERYKRLRVSATLLIQHTRWSSQSYRWSLTRISSHTHIFRSFIFFAMKFRFGLLTILLLFFVGTVLGAKYHQDENNGDASMGLARAAVQRKVTSQQLALTARRLAKEATAAGNAAQAAIQQQAYNDHTQNAATHKATALGHFQAAVTHYDNARQGRQEGIDYHGEADAGHNLALQVVKDKLSAARQGVNQNTRRRR